MIFDTDMALGVAIALLAFVLIIHSIYKSNKIRVIFKILSIPLFALLCSVLCVITVESRRKYIPSDIVAEIKAPFSSVQSDQSYSGTNTRAQAPTNTTTPAAPAAAPTTTPIPTPISQHPGATLGETNALRSAQQYLNFMHFSAKSLKNQLKYDGFSESEAAFAVANCGANWNNQASAAAKQYMELMPMSRDQLYDQLIYDGFTDMQALIGVGSVGY